MHETEIICDECDTRMRLSAALIERIAGRTGRVTCKQCSNKVSLNARGDSLVVTAGGSLFDPNVELTDEPLELVSIRDPHLSEFPEDWVDARVNEQLSSLPPPLPADLRERRAASRAMELGTQASLQDLVRQVGPIFEAPPPIMPMRDPEDTLSPHAIDNEEGLVHLGREFNSSPFSSERDETFRSLYPEAIRKRVQEPVVAPAPWAVSKAPHPPKAGQLSHASAPSAALVNERLGDAPALPVQGALMMSADGSLLNQTDLERLQSQSARPSHGPTADERAPSRWLPWSVAALSLLAFGYSVASPHLLSDKAPVVAKADKAVSVAPAAPIMVTEFSMQNGSAAQMGTAAQTHAAEGHLLTSANWVMASREDMEAAERPSTQAADAGSTETGKSEAPSASPDVETEDNDRGKPEVQTPFSVASASSAMREATALASSCRRPGDPSGVAQIVVTFAPSGRVTRAQVSGPPFAGTPTGGCIAQRFRAARVPAFSGEMVTLSRKVTIN